MCDNASFLRTLSDFVPTLREMTSALNEQSQEGKDLGSTMRKVYEITSRTLQTILNIEVALPRQVERQLPVHFQDACGFHYAFSLDWVTSWEELLVVLEIKFKHRGLRVVEKKQFVLEGGTRKRAIDLNGSWESSFYPGQNVNMDACFDEKENSRSCCPVCHHVEPVAADEAVDW